MDGGVEQIPLTIENLTRVRTNNEATDWMLPLFWSLARRYPKCQVGEIGMRGGTSTMAFLLGCDDSGGHVYSMDIDPNVYQTVEKLKGLGFTNHTFVLGDSKTTDFPDGAYFDILYIDGDHSYEGVKTDYDRHVGRVKDGGIVLIHDTRSWPDVGVFCRERKIPSIDIGAGLAFIMPNGPRSIMYYGDVVVGDNGGAHL